jgi:hypothetical protein
MTGTGPITQVEIYGFDPSSASQYEVSYDLGKTWQRVSGGTSKKVP